MHIIIANKPLQNIEMNAYQDLKNLESLHDLKLKIKKMTVAAGG